jgi:hypothetical protein
MVKTKAWKDFPGAQVSEDSLWEMTKKYNSFLNKNHGLTISTDPLNLTGINTKRDCGVSAVRALGIETEVNERNVKEKKQKKKADVVRFNLNIKTKKKLPKNRLVALKDKEPSNNNVVYGGNKNVTLRAIVKSLKRDLKNYRKDLVPVALKKVKRLSAYKLKNKWANRLEAKKIKS